MSSRVRALVVGHADFARGVVSAADSISGAGGVFVALSSADLGAEDIEKMLRETLASTGTRIIFTDLPFGSATMAARRLQRTSKELTVITGVNLPLLLAFAHQAEGDDRRSAEAALEKGRAAMQLSGGTLVG